MSDFSKKLAIILVVSKMIVGCSKKKVLQAMYHLARKCVPNSETIEQMQQKS